MEFKLKIYPSYSNDIGFPSECMSVWISESDREILLNSADIPSAPIFVKIENKGVIGKFCFYAKLDVIPPSIGLKEGDIWIPKEILHKSFLVDSNMILHVSIVDNSQFEKAEVVSIQLPKEKVDSWSEDEVLVAENCLKSNSLLAFKNQIVFVRPKTKKTVIGEVVSIYPKPHDSNQVYFLTNDTKIVFEGLSLNKQKVVDFSKIGGLDDTINRLREIIQIPLNHPEYLDKFGITPPRGLLLYGPPGNGKTMIARAIAYSMGSHFISIEGPELTTSLVGQGEEKLRERFDEARQKGNCVIFIDEIDSVAPIRNNYSARHEVTTVATLLNLMDGMSNSDGILVIGATNRIETIDPALRRPGRFDLEFEIPMPSKDARYDILHKIIFNVDDIHCDDTVNSNMIHILAELTNGYSGADLKFLYREACMHAIRTHISINKTNGKFDIDVAPDDLCVTDKHFFEALKVITPTSLRGSDIISPTCQWDEIIGIDKQREKLCEIYNNFIRLCSNDTLISRPSCGSILLTGKKGSGKRTLITSFAQKENLEIVNLDFLTLDSFDNQKSYEFIDGVIKKCRQLNDVILVLKNIDKTTRRDYYSMKILNEINSLNRYSRVFVVLFSEDSSLSKLFIGYKKFGTEINLDITKEDLRELLCKHKYAKYVGTDDFNTVGEFLTLVNQKMILGICE